jgi:hypothetical protein
MHFCYSLGQNLAPIIGLASSHSLIELSRDEGAYLVPGDNFPAFKTG